MKQHVIEQAVINISGKVAAGGSVTAVGSGLAGKAVQAVTENPHVAAQAIEWSVVGVFVGIFVGVAGLIIQAASLWRRDRRETRLYEAKIESLRGGK